MLIYNKIFFFKFKDVHNGNGICDVVDGADGVDDPHQHGDPVNSEPMNGDASNGHGEYDENSSGILDFIVNYIFSDDMCVQDFFHQEQILFLGGQ